MKELSFRRPASDLDVHRDKLEAHFRAHPPYSAQHAMDTIETLAGVKRSPERVRVFMKKTGMKCRKAGMIPAKADPAEQKTFKNELEPRLEEAKAGTQVAFFVDAAHFVLAPYMGMLWCFARHFIRAPAGRQRFNVLGALNTITHELIMVPNETYINAISVCGLQQLVVALRLAVPITLILDNARYQKCDLVGDLATSLGIELFVSPAYSPDLNLIEKLWKFVKKKCLYSIITKISRFSNKPFQPAWAKLTLHIKKLSTRSYLCVFKRLNIHSLCHCKV